MRSETGPSRAGDAPAEATTPLAPPTGPVEAGEPVSAPLTTPPPSAHDGPSAAAHDGRAAAAHDGRAAAAHDGQGPSDEELEARWKGGSAPAFAVLFERYHGRIYGFAYRLTGDTHTAEDVAQRAFLNLYRKPSPGTGRASFRSLLFTVTRNEALNEIKRRGRRREAALDRSPEAADDRRSPAEAADAREVGERVQQALATLPEDEREVVLLREAEGLTFREVCEVTGLSRDAVRWRLARGMEHLRRALQEGGGTCP